jgi:2-formylbenzoate dehydrogenase
MTEESLSARALELAAGEHRMLIGGRLAPAAGRRVYEVTDPATGTVVASAPDASAEDMDDAIAAAERTWRRWVALPLQERAAVVRAMADIADAHLDEIALLDSLDTGVSLSSMRRDAAIGIRRMRMFSDWALRLTGETIPAGPAHLTYTQRVPFGIVGRIIAYNHPAQFGISKIAAPLIAGNAVIAKPSPLTPLSMLRLADLWAGVLPEGVLSVITGASVAIGEQLVRDARVRRIAFTGGPDTGRAIQRTAAEVAVKTVSLELGGKNALIVLPDADLDAVATGVVEGMAFDAAGQSCGSTSRLLVPREVADAVIGRVEALFAGILAGSPFDPDTTLGPLISPGQHRNVSVKVEAAIATSGRLVAGGHRPAGLADGNFYAATLIEEKDAASPLATEEVFGPVLTVIATDSTDQAVAVANSVRYGLTASVYGSDIGQALAVANRMDTGYVWVNDTGTHLAAAPFGGVKDSGTGREESFEELVDYTQLRATSVRLTWPDA